MNVDLQRIRALQRSREHRVPPVDPRIIHVELGEDGYRALYRHLVFICSESKEDDGRWWRHASVSRRNKTLPTYDDLKLLKEICIGPDLVAYQLFMSKDKHIDLAGPRVEVLHLWACLEGPVTPDFSAGTGSI